MALVGGKAIDQRADALQLHRWMPDLTVGGETRLGSCALGVPLELLVSSTGAHSR